MLSKLKQFSNAGIETDSLQNNEADDDNTMIILIMRIRMHNKNDKTHHDSTVSFNSQAKLQSLGLEAFLDGFSKLSCVFFSQKQTIDF